LYLFYFGFYWLRRGSNELPNSFKYGLKMTVVLTLQVINPMSEILVGNHQLTDVDKHTHDSDVDLDSAVATEDTREHGDTLLGEDVG